MSERTLKTLVAVLAVLVVVYAVVTLVGRGGGGGGPDGALAAALDGLGPESVQRVRIEGPSDTVELRTREGRWMVNGYVADSAQVQRLWTAIDESSVGDVAARNPANHSRLGVAEDSTWAVEFVRASGDPVRIFVGKSGPTYPSGYVRLPGEDAVYTIRGEMRGTLTRSLSQWRDKTIVTVDTAAVRTVVVERDGESYSLVRDEEAWSVEGAPADSAAVQTLLDEIAALEGYGFAPDATELGDEDARRVVALGEAGDTLAVVEMAKGEGSNHEARVPGGDTVYQLSSWRADRIAPERSQVEAEEEASGEGEGGSGG